MVQKVETLAHQQKCCALKPILCCHVAGTEERPTGEVRATILFMSVIDEKKKLTSFRDATLSTQE